MELSKEQMAINRLMCGNTAHSCKADYIQLAIKALEKQIPKRMMVTNHTHFDLTLMFRCPSCDTEFNRFYEGKQYCMECGQKLKWGD